MPDSARPAGGGEGQRFPVTHRLRVDPSLSMQAVTGEVEGLLWSLAEGTRRSGALLASELVAQVVGRTPGRLGESVALTIRLRADAVRLEATGPVVPTIGPDGDGTGRSDKLADWGRYLLDRLADRWGVADGDGADIWAEIDVAR